MAGTSNHAGHVVYLAQEDEPEISEDALPKNTLLNSVINGSTSSGDFILTFRNLSLWDEDLSSASQVLCGGRKPPMLQFLRDATATIASGRFTVLIGNENSGKKELLNLLNGRKTHGDIEGVLATSIDGVEQEFAFYQTSGYVDEVNYLPSSLTVIGYLSYVAEMTLPWRMSKAERQSRVDRVIEVLDLQSCAHKIIRMNEERLNLTPAQAKLVSIAAAIMPNPTFLFLAQPTLSLPSAAGTKVMKQLQSLAAIEGTTVVATLDFVDSDSYQFVDQLMLLHQGEIIYHGDSGPKAIAYFEARGYPSIATSANPVDHFNSIIRKAEIEGSMVVMTAAYRNSISDHSLQSSDGLRRPVRSFRKQCTNNALFNFLVLLRRNAMARFHWQNILWPFARMAVITSICTSLYLNTDSETGNERFARLAFLFVSVVLFFMVPVGFAHETFEQRRLAVEEGKASINQVSAYYFSSIIVDLVYHALASAIWISPVYWAMPYWNHSENYIFFWITITICAEVGSSYLQTLVDLYSGVRRAINTFLFTFVILLPFCGFFLRYPEIRSYWTWGYWANPIHWAFAGLIENEVYGNYATYKDNQRDIFLSYGLWVVNPSEGLDYLFLNAYIHLAALVGFYVLFRIFSFLTLMSRAS